MPSKPQPPTERQLAYAHSLGIAIPANATKADLSDLISAAVEKDKPSTARHRAFAKHFGIATTDYIGKKALFSLIQATLVQGERDRDLMAWFTYRVYRSLTNAADNTPISGPGDPTIQAIAETLATDAKIVKSARRYEGTDLIYFGEWTSPDGCLYNGGSKNTAAYKAAESQIRQRAIIPKPRQQVSDAAMPRIQTTGHSRPAGGCLRSMIRLAIWAFVAFVGGSILLSVLF